MKKILIMVGFIILLTLFIPSILIKSNATTDEQIQVGDLYYKIISEEYKMVEVDGVCQKDLVTSVIIPKTIKIEEQDYIVTDIGSSAFCLCKNLTNLTIPNSVTYIGRGAFSLCTSLETIEIPNSVKYIGDMAFYKCKNLKHITLSNSLTSLNSNIFFECTSLITIEIPNSVKYIGSQSFGGCENLKTITIPNSVMNIDKSIFKYGDAQNSNYNNIVIITEIGSYAEFYAKDQRSKVKVNTKYNRK